MEVTAGDAVGRVTSAITSRTAPVKPTHSMSVQFGLLNNLSIKLLRISIWTIFFQTAITSPRISQGVL
jgi:hypothetical protein